MCADGVMVPAQVLAASNSPVVRYRNEKSLSSQPQCTVSTVIEVSRPQVLIAEAGLWSGADEKSFVIVCGRTVAFGKLEPVSGSVSSPDVTGCIGETDDTRTINVILGKAQDKLNSESCCFQIKVTLMAVMSPWSGVDRYDDKEASLLTSRGTAIVFIPDIHIGIRNRADDFSCGVDPDCGDINLRSLTAFLEGVRESGICETVQLGDFFDLWEVEARCWIEECLRKLSICSDSSWNDPFGIIQSLCQSTAEDNGEWLLAMDPQQVPSYLHHELNKAFEEATNNRSGPLCGSYSEQAVTRIQEEWGRERIEGLQRLFDRRVPGNHDMSSLGAVSTGTPEEATSEPWALELGKNGRILALHGHTFDPWNSPFREFPGKALAKTSPRWIRGKKETWSVVIDELFQDRNAENRLVRRFGSLIDVIAVRDHITDEVERRWIRVAQRKLASMKTRLIVMAHTHEMENYFYKLLTGTDLMERPSNIWLR